MPNCNSGADYLLPDFGGPRCLLVHLSDAALRLPKWSHSGVGATTVKKVADVCERKVRSEVTLCVPPLAAGTRAGAIRRVTTALSQHVYKS